MKMHESRRVKSVLGAILGVVLLGTLLVLEGQRGGIVVPGGNSSGKPVRSESLVKSDVRLASAKPAVEQRRVIGQKFGRLPLRFEENLGQTDARVRFLSRNAGYLLFLTPQEAVMSFIKKSSEAGGTSSQVVFRMSFLGAEANPEVLGEDRLSGKSNYLRGNDPAKWSRNVSGFAKVRYRNIYQGIDLVYYGANERQLEYDLVVAPGADPRMIGFKVDGAEDLRKDENGNLIIEAGGVKVVQHAPVVFQKVDGKRKKIEAAYRLEDGRVGFEVAAYDQTRALVIDPVIGFSTYLGGADVEEVRAVAVGPQGNIFAGGTTLSSDFPITAGVVQGGFGGSRDGFIAKLDPSGTSLVYSTFIGGTLGESILDLCVDGQGQCVVTGNTASTDFPTANAFQNSNNGGSPSGYDAFVAKMDQSGANLVFSTYLGGTDEENEIDNGGVCVDGAGNVYVTGNTNSFNFPVLDPISGHGSLRGNSDVFLTRFAPNGTLQFSSFFGGTFGFQYGYGIAVDGGGGVYITGETNSSNFPLARAAQGFFGGTKDAFVARFNPVTSTYQVDYSTYLGGSKIDRATSIAVDGSGNAFIAGFTDSTNFPVTAGAFQVSKAGVITPTDSFVTTIPAPVTGTAVLGFSTYLGGSEDDGDIFAGRIRVAPDANGNVWVAGSTRSTDFPVQNPFQAARGGSGPFLDAYVAALNPAGSALVFSSYFGGSDDEVLFGMALDKDCAVILSGFSGSGDLPLVTPLQNLNPGTEGSQGGFVAKVVLVTPDGIDDGFTVAEDQVLTVAAPGLLANDVCVSKSVVISSTTNGALALNPDGSFSYTPNANFSGTDSFTYRASNASVLDPVETTAVITVTNVGDTPVALDDSYGGSQGRRISITSPGVLGNDSDADGDALSVTVITNATNGTLLLNTNGSFTYEPDAGFVGTDTFTYQATDGTLTSNTATVTITLGLATDVPVANLQVSPDTGFGSITATLDGSLSSDPNSVALTTYQWNFGDGSTASTTTNTTTHEYSNVGAFVASLSVTNANGFSSDAVYFPVVVADGMTGDEDLFLNKMSFKINFGQHKNGTDADFLSLSGLLNPAGLPRNLGGATITVRLNNGQTLGSQGLRARLRKPGSRRGRASARAGTSFIGILDPNTGKFSFKAKNVDLRAELGVTEETVEKMVKLEVEVEISGVSIDTPKIKGVLETSIKSTKGKVASGKFNFLQLGTLTGVIKSQRTRAIESSAGGHKILSLGPMVSDLSEPLVPIGDVTLTIGSSSQNVVITIPFAAFKQKGTDAGSIYTYSKALLAIPELKKFQINNKKRKFVLVTNNLTGTGIPVVGSGQLTYQLPLVLDTTTTNGAVHLETTIELRRKSDSSKAWVR